MPSSSQLYSLDKFHSALAAGFGNKVSLYCQWKTVNVGKIPLVSEAYFCYDTETLTPIDCPLADRNCAEQIGYYPTNTWFKEMMDDEEKQGKDLSL